MLVRLFSVLLLSILVAAGCARNTEQQGEVSGKVTYNGKPLPGGRIIFVGARGYTGQGVISPQGEYSIQSPLGKVQIGVNNRMLKTDPDWEKYKGKAAKMKTPMDDRPKDASGGAGTPPATDAATTLTKGGITGTYVNLPARYADPSASGLTFTVTEGSQTHNIELTDDDSSAKPGS